MSIDAFDLDCLRRITDARSVDAPALVEQLRAMTARTHSREQRKPMDEAEKLLDEAFWYASRGEIDEALYRLSAVEEQDFEYDWED